MTPEETTKLVLKSALKVPGVKINREEFLEKELKNYCDESQVEMAIKLSPQKAGISKNLIDKISDICINYETNKVTLISGITGLPGGWTLAATIPADVAQYFAHIMIIAQKLAYLHGWRQVDSIEDDLNSESANELLIFIAVMMGVGGIGSNVASLASKIAANNGLKFLFKGMWKNATFKLIQKILKQIGIKITQTSVSKAFSKVVPILGGIISGAVTYNTYKPMCKKLKEALSQKVDDIEDAEIIKIIEED